MSLGSESDDTDLEEIGQSRAPQSDVERKYRDAPIQHLIDEWLQLDQVNITILRTLHGNPCP